MNVIRANIMFEHIFDVEVIIRKNENYKLFVSNWSEVLHLEKKGTATIRDLSLKGVIGKIRAIRSLESIITNQ